MYQALRRGHLALIFVYLLKIATLYGLEYKYETFHVQPHPIQFLREPNDYFTFPSVDVTFVCSLTISNDSTRISWLHNNTIIGAEPHYSISSKGQSINTLTIRNVSTEDQGLYHCCVSDWKTKVRSKPGRLHVVDDGKMSDGNITIYKIIAVYKSTVILPCDSKPDTKPVWLRNELVLDLKEFNQTLFIDEGGNLVLVNVSEDHSGHYQCQVNKSGTTKIGSSYVLTAQNLIGSLDESGKSSSQYLLIIPNHCGKSPHNQTVTLQCPVTGHPSPIISWYLNGELVNLTDYNITDNVGNNTWIIQGGDPCRLIGYWQCFATNEAGTVHNEIRVLPYGWSNRPREPRLKVAELNENILSLYDNIFDRSVIYYAGVTMHVNITWSPPQYLGGLDASDIYYQLHATGYDDINTTNTYSVLFYEVNFSTNKKALNVSIAIHYNGSTTDALYIPSNVIEKKQYDNLLCDAVEFKPPQIFAQCFENGTAHFSWNLSPNQGSPNQSLSLTYLENSRNGWRISGNCTYENNMPTSVFDHNTYSNNYMNLNNLTNGTQCIYEIQPDYDGCNCRQSCKGSASCTISIVSPTIIISPSTTTVAVKSLEISSTAIGSFIFAAMEPKSVSVTNNRITFTTQSILSGSSAITDNPITLTIQSTSNSSITIVPAITSSPTITTAITDNPITLTVTQSTLNGSSTDTVADDSILLATQSTSNGSFINTPNATSFTTSSNDDTSSTTLFITVGVLISLLIGSIIIFCTVLCIYRWKSTGKYADIRFLKMSQAIKMMKPPLSNNYCSTINIADESVCEIPVNKVKRWIDDNDFRLNGKSSSFQSIATSQMFAYIRKDDKISKELSSESLADYVDDIQLDKQLESVCNRTCNEGNKNSNSLISLYVDEAHLNQEAHLTKTNSSEINPYCDENAVFNNVLHPSHSHTSLPDYMEESYCRYHRDGKKSHESLSSTSQQQQQHHARISDKLYTSKDSYTSSLPILMPCVPNPVLAKSFDLIQSSSNETSDKVPSISDSNLSDNHDQKSKDDIVDSGLNTDCSRVDSALNSHSLTEALQSSQYYRSLSSSSKEMNSNDSSSDPSLGSNHSNTNASINASSATSSLGYFELPADKYTYFGSRTSSRKNSLSELDFDIDIQLHDISATSNINRCFANNISSVDFGYVQLPLPSENLKQNQPKDNVTMNDYILSIENVV